MNPALQNTPAILSLELGAAILFWLVFVVVETAVLQLINWGTFQECLRAAFYANLASLVVVALSLMAIPRFGLVGLLVGLGLVIFIEGLVLTRMEPASRQHGWLAAILANLASFLILILPVYWIVRGMLSA